MRRTAYLALAILAALARPATALDADTIARKAAERQREMEHRLTDIHFLRVDVETEFRSDGGRRKPKRLVFACRLEAPGALSRELMEVDGRPPTESEKQKIRKQDNKRKARQAERKPDETEDDDLLSGRLPLTDLLTRYDFAHAGEEVVDGALTYLLSFGPKKGLASPKMRDRVLNNFSGKVWVDAAELQVRRIEAHLTRPLKILGGLALDLEAIRIRYEGRPSRPGVWLPCREEIHFTAKTVFFLGVSKEIRFEFSNYKIPPPGDISTREEKLPAARAAALTLPEEGAR